MNLDKFTARRYSFSRKKIYAWLVVTIISLLCVGGILFIITAIKQDAIDDLVAYEEQLIKEVAVLGRLKKERTSLEELHQGQQLKLTKIDKLSDITRNTPYHFLLEVADIIPESIILNSFTFDTKKIELEGSSDAVQGITHLMRELSQSKLFQKPKLVSMNRNGREVAFIIQAFKA
ncbi:TPA: hypothetical protein DIC20_03755 [Candidatus Dependentiae bacterium]|nr:MAG: hypothetical protein US03_C0001G0138 [candidate division TM6 bacterium GW2011_GWF2_36_131]KKQ03726.1 MAG: hypothetical protein US13_C0001G0066 [candidate division TM6 bacterium GW2011_GWE2_36_25]KKQ20038.1 MAG: hypothetical protein US32_C0002G0043 [candidate division TM6 bacterium GW2011_GWA2_36_9]HBR70493.1 hypothetical protein [Candidatus Dependentiae bacterium]HCU00791.1 hypothetical protein [Candidatus Dependentiae bacterium]